MKMRLPHIVPLTRQTIALLTQLKAITGHGKHLFPNVRRPEAPMTNTSVNRALEYCGYKGKFSGHGFRATASTHLNEGTFTDANGKPVLFRFDTIEAQLAHTERNASRGAYNRAEYIAERRVMMNVWSDFLDSLTSDNVIPISGRNTGTKAA
jgi:integrase